MSDLATFNTHRPRLWGLAYRMLGIRADADDVLQEAWLRWREVDGATLASSEAWLVTVTTRLAIDRLRVQKREREQYPGPWLPEPVTEFAAPPEAAYEFVHDVSLAFLAVLERLSPQERAAYLLYEVFDTGYDEIAAMLDKSAAACRQIVHRARERIQAAKPRFAVSQDQHRALLARFAAAAQSGTAEQLLAVFADEAMLVSDGGGKAVAARRPLHGAERLMRLFQVLARQRDGQQQRFMIASFNGEPGLLHYLDGVLVTAYAVVGDGERIHALYAVRNPDKLAALSQA